MPTAPSFDLSRYLSTLPLFGGLGPDELDRLAHGSQLRRLARGDVLFRAGQPCDAFHVVVFGQMKLSALSPKGAEKVVELPGPGQSFAEAVMFLDRPYVVEATALSDALVVSVGKAAVLAEIAADPQFALRMLAVMAQRMHSMMRDLKAQTLKSGIERVIGYLLASMDAPDASGPHTVALPVSKATLASRLSITPEYFSRVLHELESARLIRVEGRTIHIPDVAELAAYQPPR